jgi:hypothetical protein
MLRQHEIECEKIGGRWRVGIDDLPAAERDKHLP